jgi:hypothetical protein
MKERVLVEFEQKLFSSIAQVTVSHVFHTAEVERSQQGGQSKSVLCRKVCRVETLSIGELSQNLLTYDHIHMHITYIYM